MRALYFIVIIIVIVGCNKYRDLRDKDDLNASLYYSGQLQFANDLDSTGIPYFKSNVQLRLFKKPDTLNYLFDTKTDSLGFYSYRSLKNGEYRIQLRQIINSIIYDSTRDFSIQGDNNFVDVPWTIKPSFQKQNGIVYTTRDRFGGFMNGCSIFLYSSIVLANADTGYTGIGSSVMMLPTNGYGKSAKVNIPNLPLYIVQIKSINNLRVRDTIYNVPLNGILRREITLQ
jgi:hypothetical protein